MMQSIDVLRGLVRGGFFLGLVMASGLQAQTPVVTKTNVTVRVMAANLNGNTQSYQPFALRILKGLKPDVVCIQEFNYSNNTAADLRFMVTNTLGTNYVYYREPYTASGNIPNGVISRYPFVTNGSWADALQSQPNRGYAWARIDLPGTNDLYVVSVHLLTSSASVRSSEATNLKALIQANFPANAWIVVAGDFNCGSRTESSTMTTFGSYVSDKPIPTDAVSGGNSDTSANRNSPHDYVLASFSLTNIETASVFPSHSFPNGLVFDSRVYTPLSDVAPVQQADSGLAQHMAVLKDFSVPYLVTNYVPVVVPPPVLVLQSSNVLQWAGVSNVTYTVQANTDLGATNWATLGTASSTSTNLVFTNSAAGMDFQFFRVTYP